VTGVVLATMFVPSTNSAFQSLSHIQNDALFGHIVRGMHYFGASAMFLFIGIHMLRVFLYASYKYPREINWLSGVVLLILTLAMGFTGQLMRWNQNAIWSVNIAAKQAAHTPFIGGLMSRLIYGGDHLSGLTLTRFFDLHVFVIPATIMAIVGFHLYLVLYNGISEPPKAGAPVNPATYKDQYSFSAKRAWLSGPMPHGATRFSGHWSSPPASRSPSWWERRSLCLLQTPVCCKRTGISRCWRSTLMLSSPTS
jgi:ubiquinol-cytochrome c reductase cytochrome b subunit